MLAAAVATGVAATGVSYFSEAVSPAAQSTSMAPDGRVDTVASCVRDAQPPPRSGDRPPGPIDGCCGPGEFRRSRATCRPVSRT